MLVEYQLAGRKTLDEIQAQPPNRQRDERPGFEDSLELPLRKPQSGFPGVRSDWTGKLCRSAAILALLGSGTLIGLLTIQNRMRVGGFPGTALLLIATGIVLLVATLVRAAQNSGNE